MRVSATTDDNYITLQARGLDRHRDLPYSLFSYVVFTLLNKHAPSDSTSKKVSADPCKCKLPLGNLQSSKSKAVDFTVELFFAGHYKEPPFRICSSVQKGKRVEREYILSYDPYTGVWVVYSWHDI